MDEFQYPVTIRDQNLTGHPSTLTHSTSCTSVCGCWGTSLSKCHHGVSVNPCCASHPHSRFACVGTVSSMSVMLTTWCLCNTHTESNRGFPGPHPLLHMCWPVSLSKLSLSVPLSASRCISLYVLLTRLWSTVRHGVVIFLCVAGDSRRWTDWLSIFQILDSFLQVRQQFCPVWRQHW